MFHCLVKSYFFIASCISWVWFLVTIIQALNSIKVLPTFLVKRDSCFAFLVTNCRHRNLIGRFLFLIMESGVGEDRKVLWFIFSSVLILKDATASKYTHQEEEAKNVLPSLSRVSSPELVASFLNEYKISLFSFIIGQTCQRFSSTSLPRDKNGWHSTKTSSRVQNSCEFSGKAGIFFSSVLSPPVVDVYSLERFSFLTFPTLIFWPGS